MHAVQQPLATSALGHVMGVPAWKADEVTQLIVTAARPFDRRLSRSAASTQVSGSCDRELANGLADWSIRLIVGGVASHHDDLYAGRTVGSRYLRLDGMR